jgi:hypothetical protein
VKKEKLKREIERKRERERDPHKKYCWEFLMSQIRIK